VGTGQINITLNRFSGAFYKKKTNAIQLYSFNEEGFHHYWMNIYFRQRGP